MDKKFDFSRSKKRFAKAASDSRYRHKKAHIKWLKAQGFSADDYDISDHAEPLDLAKLWCHAQGVCAWCGKDLAPDELGQDHLIPIAKGGSNSAHNIVLCCPDCNSRKATKHPARFAAEQKASGITTSLIDYYLEKYENNPGVQQILGQDFLD